MRHSVIGWGTSATQTAFDTRAKRPHQHRRRRNFFGAEEKQRGGRDEEHPSIPFRGRRRRGHLLHPAARRRRTGRHADHRTARRAIDARSVHSVGQRLDLCHRPDLRAADLGRQARNRARARPRGIVGGFRRRPDLHLQAPRRGQVQRRHAGDGRRRDLLARQGLGSGGGLRLRLRRSREHREDRGRAAQGHPEEAERRDPLGDVAVLRLDRLEGRLRGRPHGLRLEAGLHRPLPGRELRARHPARPRPQPELLADGRGRQAAALCREGRAEIRAGKQFARPRPAKRRLRRDRRRAAQPGRRGRLGRDQHPRGVALATGSTMSTSTTPRRRSTTRASGSP